MEKPAGALVLLANHLIRGPTWTSDIFNQLSRLSRCSGMPSRVKEKIVRDSQGNRADKNAKLAAVGRWGADVGKVAGRTARDS